MCFYHTPTSAPPPPPTFFWEAPGTPKSIQKCIKTQWGDRCVKVRPQSGHGGRKGRQGGPKGHLKSAKNTSRGTPGTPFWHLGLKMRTFAKHQYLLCFSHISIPGGLLLGTPGSQSNSHGALTAKMDAKVMQRVPRGTPRERPGWPP